MLWHAQGCIRRCHHMPTVSAYLKQIARSHIKMVADEVCRFGKGSPSKVTLLCCVRCMFACVAKCIRGIGKIKCLHVSHVHVDVSSVADFQGSSHATSRHYRRCSLRSKLPNAMRRNEINDTRRFGARNRALRRLTHVVFRS